MRPSSLAGWALFGLVAMVLVVAVAVFGARYGVLTPQARLLIEARSSGIKLGQLGRLKVEGLEGDVWRHFTIRRLTISDEKGVWLEGQNLDLRWRFAELLRRRLAVDAVTAQRVRILRRPTLSPKGPPSKGLPITFDIRSMAFPVETLPAFSTRAGLFDVSGALSLERNDRGQKGAVTAKSLTHAGDFLAVQFDVGRTRPLLVIADGLEARGGALAGALGLPADRTFAIAAKAVGSGRGGRLDVRLVSGTSTPLDAHGGWTPAGGSIAGRAQLGASSLTRGYVRMFGPEAVVAVAGRRARGGQYGVAGLVRAQNLVVVTQGPADLKTLSSGGGLKTAIRVADLSRLVKDPAMGPGQAQGLLTGSRAAWRFLGTATVQDARLPDYRIARVSGPVAVSGRGRELTVHAALAAAGGTGRGLMAGMIGPAPHAVVDMVRLADGRLLIRKADAQGAGFTLTSSGSRSLLGSLDFKGGLRVKDLGQARPGAAGALEAKWSASQASAARPWLINLDGRGSGFRSGLDELDRMLGTEPRVQVKAAWGGGVVQVADARVDGAKAGASAQGRLDPKGPLALQVKWQAEGPFQAGPVQITGKASGDGAVTGTLAAPRADLNADFGAIDIPRLPLRSTHVHLTFLKDAAGAAGEIAATGESEYGPARARSAFRFAGDGLDLSGIEADAGGVKASGALALRGSAPSSADLQLTVGPGAVLTEGRLSGTVRIVDGATPSATVNLTAEAAAVRGSGVLIRTARLSGSGPLSRLPFQVSGEVQTAQGPVNLAGSGLYQDSAGARQVAFDGAGRFRQVDFKPREPITLRFTGPDRTARVRVAVGGGELDLDARQGAGGATASGVLRGVDLKSLNRDFAGKITGDIALQGRGAHLDGTMNARLDDARSVDAGADVAMDAVIKGVLTDTRLTIDAQASGANGLKASASVVLPVEASAAPLHLAIVRNRPLQGRYSAEGEVKPLWDLVYGSERELAGQVSVQGSIAGTLADPLLTGGAAVTNGRFQDFSTGLVLTSLSLDAALDRDLVTLKSLSARDDKSGQVSGSGSFSLERGGGSSLKLDLQRFRLLDNDTAEATATGGVTVTRAADGKVKVEGALTLDRAQINAETKLRPSVVSIDVIERNMPGRNAAETRPRAARGPPIALDVTLRAPRRVFVKGRGVDAELSLDAHVTGSMAQPALDGTARIVQGSYDFAGKRFEFDESGVIHLATSADQMRLELSASWEAPTITATVRIKGTAAKPEISLTSSPSLPQEEILAQVLFGSSASQLSGAETAQLASTVTALATGGGFDVLGSLRQFARLDRLSFGGDQTSGVTVAGGKYIADDVYLEIIGGGREGPTAEVDWRIRRGFSLVSQLGGQFGAKLAVRWTRDIGRDRAGREGAGRR